METAIVQNVPLTPDQQLINLWLHGRASKHTQRAYRSDANRLIAYVACPLAVVTLAQLQGFADTLKGEPETRRRTLAAVKSLFRFAHRLGYCPFDTAAPLILPVPKDDLAERILTEEQVQQMISSTKDARDRTILLVLYATGLRVSELCGLSWRDCVKREIGGQVTTQGKRGKTRAIVIPESVWDALISLKPLCAAQESPVFVGIRGRFTPSTIHRIVKECAKRAGITSAHIGPHALRHSMASHAIDRGAPLHVVQQSLGHHSLQVTGRYLHVRPGMSAAMFLAV